MPTAAQPSLQTPGARGPPGRLRALLRVLDFLAALLCLWAATAHTPPGALLRTLGARVLGTRSSARPLLAYYSAGVYAPGRGGRPPRPLPPLPRTLQPALALGYGEIGRAHV